MLDKNQLKQQGLRFGRSLQACFKTAMIYSVDHPSAAGNMQNTFNSLNALVKQTQQLTIGFINGRVMINNVMTNDDNLNHLEQEFGKRGIAAIAFEAGITLGGFKRVMAVASVKDTVIEERGGIRAYLEDNRLEGARILPAPKRRSAEDELMQTEAESFFMSQELMDMEPAAGSRGLQFLLESVGMVKPQDLGGSAGEILDLAGKSVQAALTDPNKDPRDALGALARMMDELRPDFLMGAMPSGRRAELQGKAPREVATELMEDYAVGWATRRLVSAPQGPEIMGVEEEVVRVLLRSLKATQVAERVLKKLSVFLGEANLPTDVFDRVRQGMAWAALSQSEQYEELKKIKRYDTYQFRRLLKFVEEALAGRRIEFATTLVDQYFIFLKDPEGIHPEELARAQELLKISARLQTREFIQQLTDRLGQVLMTDKPMDSRAHKELSKCLVTICHGAVLYEDYPLVQKVALDLEKSLARGRSVHEFCCQEALSRLVMGSSIERLVEIFVEKKDDPSWARTISYLLKIAGSPGIEKVFQRVESETDTNTRMRLLRVIGQSGPAGIAVAKARLKHPQWYVVRNACNILADLNDPDIVANVKVGLEHEDERVQQAAVNVIMKSRSPKRGEVFANALPRLKSHMLEKVLDELLLMREPGSLPGLQSFLMESDSTKPAQLQKAVQLVSVIPGDQASEVLGKVLFASKLPIGVRRAALIALSRKPTAVPILAEFAKFAGNDPLAGECQTFLKAMSA